jgi:acetate---CoA ligase (ADP-forming)
MNFFDNFFYPKSIAIIGASSKPGNLSYELIGNLLKFDFKGTIYPINPKADIVNSLKAFKSVLDVSSEIDLAIIMVPKIFVLNAIDECYEKQINSVILITAGFRETGYEGEKLETELLERIKKYNIRLVGPNCMGIINSKPGVNMNGTFVLGDPLNGGIGFCSQSGALGAAVLKTVQQNDIGMGQFISVGNKADVTENDILKYWKNNDDIKVITLYLESFSNPVQFTQIVKEITKTKPVILIKAARTSAGMKAASSHTGALASGDAIANALIEQSGAIRVYTVGQMFSLAKAFDKANTPRGKRVGILTNAGGPAILCVDECAQNGLELPEMSNEVKKKIMEFAPPEASLHNPVDLLPPASADMWAKAARYMIEDDNFDSLIIIMGPPLMHDTVEIMNEVNEAVKGFDKSVLFVIMSQDENIPKLQKIAPDHPPIYKYPESAARALGEMIKYNEFQKREHVKKTEFSVNKKEVEKIFNTISTTGDFYLDFEFVYKILKAYELPIIDTYTLREIASTIECANKIGFPVVLKSVGKELVHKTDIGGVKLNLKNQAELENAIEDINENLKSKRIFDKLEGYLIQPYFSGGTETILGVVKDINAGHLIMFGLGGILVELLKDVKFRLKGLDETDAMEMIKSLKGYKILEGIRGNKGADIGYIVECIMKLSKLVDDFPMFEEIDLNPFVVSSSGGSSKILDARMRVKL